MNYGIKWALRCIINNNRSKSKWFTFAVCITIAGGATRKHKKIQSLGAIVYCAAPLRPQSAALLVRAPRFSSERRALYLYATVVNWLHDWSHIEQYLGLLIIQGCKTSSQSRSMYNKNKYHQFWATMWFFCILALRGTLVGHSIIGRGGGGIDRLDPSCFQAVLSPKIWKQSHEEVIALKLQSHFPGFGPRTSPD